MKNVAENIILPDVKAIGIIIPMVNIVVTLMSTFIQLAPEIQTARPVDHGINGIVVMRDMNGEMICQNVVLQAMRLVTNLKKLPLSKKREFFYYMTYRKFRVYSKFNAAPLKCDKLFCDPTSEYYRSDWICTK